MFDLRRLRHRGLCSWRRLRRRGSRPCELGSSLLRSVAALPPSVAPEPSRAANSGVTRLGDEFAKGARRGEAQRVHTLQKDWPRPHFDRRTGHRGEADEYRRAIAQLTCSWPAPGSGLSGAGERSGGAEGGKNRGHRATNRRSGAEAKNTAISGCSSRFRPVCDAPRRRRPRRPGRAGTPWWLPCRTNHAGRRPNLRRSPQGGGRRYCSSRPDP